MIARRNLLLGLGALVAAPAVIRTPGLLMPVRAAEDRMRYRISQENGEWGPWQDFGDRYIMTVPSVSGVTAIRFQVAGPRFAIVQGHVFVA